MDAVNLSSRGYYDLKNYTEALPPSEQEKVASRLLEGSLDYDITLDDALKMEVRVQGKLRTLAWVAENKPERLELLIDTMEPGSVLFQAITLVYDESLDAVLKAVKKQNDRIREAGIRGLHEWNRKKRGHIGRTRVYLQDMPKVRLYLSKETLRRLGGPTRRRVYLLEN